MRYDWSSGPLRNAPEFELSEAIKRHIEKVMGTNVSEEQKPEAPQLELSDETKAAIEHALVTVMQNFAIELLNVFSVASSAMQSKIIEAASKQAESPPTE